jgi:hypothetical protein
LTRRVSLQVAVEFTKPDLLLRERIWREMAPPKLPLAGDIDFMALARKYELPGPSPDPKLLLLLLPLLPPLLLLLRARLRRLAGGFIKNAWLSALSLAVAREGTKCTITQEDLHKGGSHQLRGRLAMSQFDRGIVPQRGLEEVEVTEKVKEKLRQIVNYSKAQAVLFGQWGFEKQHGRAQGIAALFHGIPGTGKTMAAEAIGFDIGRPVSLTRTSRVSHRCM